jgi:hypothetical protein
MLVHSITHTLTPARRRHVRHSVAIALATLLALGLRTAFAQVSDPVYQTVNGQQSLTTMIDQLRAAGYGGPWDQDAVVASYATTTGGAVTPVVPAPAELPSAFCAGFNQYLVYQVWDRTGSSGPCTPWDGYTLMDPSWVDDHATFGLGTNAKTGEAVAWACGVVIGAARAADAPMGANIYVRGAPATSGAWSDWLIKEYGALPCSLLEATFANHGPDVHYRQAW